jgi:hypothetical protein
MHCWGVRTLARKEVDAQAGTTSSFQQWAFYAGSPGIAMQHAHNHHTLMHPRASLQGHLGAYSTAGYSKQIHGWQNRRALL